MLVNSTVPGPCSEYACGATGVRRCRSSNSMPRTTATPTTAPTAAPAAVPVLADEEPAEAPAPGSVVVVVVVGAVAVDAVGAVDVDIVVVMQRVSTRPTQPPDRTWPLGHEEHVWHCVSLVLVPGA